jgi:hypothetical protein
MSEGAVCGGEFSLDMMYYLEPLTRKERETVVRRWRRQGLSATHTTKGKPRKRKPSRTEGAP